MCLKLFSNTADKPCLAIGPDANTAVKVDKNGVLDLEMDW
jgi:hypothetical protein